MIFHSWPILIPVKKASLHHESTPLQQLEVAHDLSNCPAGRKIIIPAPLSQGHRHQYLIVPISDPLFSTFHPRQKDTKEKKRRNLEIFDSDKEKIDNRNQAPANFHSERRKPLNGRTSGTWSGHRDRRTSWARRGGCRRRGGCGRTARTPASAGSWSARRRTSGSRRRGTWRWPGGWRRSGRSGHRRRRGRGCRHRRTCQRRQ